MQEHSAAITQVTAAIRTPKDSDTQTVFTWLITNRYLWMLDDEHFANRVEAVVGTNMLIDLVAELRRWKKKHKDHPALKKPAKANEIKRAFTRLRQFFTLNI